MSKKYTKAVLQDLYDNQVAINEALEKRLEDLEARLSNRGSIPLRTNTVDVNPANSLMVETAKIIQDSSTVEKNSPFLKNVNEESWAAFALLYTHYRIKGGLKPTRDLMTAEVLNYYSYQISGDFMLMDDQSLFNSIHKINQPSIDPMDVLISGLTMKYSKVYDKNLVQQYISSFITLLENYPIIKAQCKSEAIVKQFYKKLQPNSLSQDMLNLEIKDVTEAIQTLHSKLTTKDIQHFENTRDLKKHVVTESIDLKRNQNVEKCANCKFSSKAENFQLHRLWYCHDLNFCYRCNHKHLALGPDCKFKDRRIFDYEAYLDKNKRVKDHSNQMKDLKVANIATEDYINRSDFDELESLFVDQMKKLEKTTKKTSDSDVSKILSGSDLIIDSGCNHTCINDPTQSTSAIKFNRRRTKDSIWVADGRAVDIEGTGTILNHNCSLVPKFPSSLLSVSQINKVNEAISIFTSSDCKIIKLDNSINNLLQIITTTAERNNLLLVNGIEENEIYKCLFKDLQHNNKSSKVRKLTIDNNSAPQQASTNKLAGASYYTNVPSASVDSIKELVRFFHEIWNHASLDLMCSIV